MRFSNLLFLQLAAAGAVTAASRYLTNKTMPYAVDGANLPEIPFDVGESYAGNLPITANASDPNTLWFWFFPAKTAEPVNELVIWLNGGPGCTSLIGIFYEMGPFTWRLGTVQPVDNPWSWTNLTNVIWMDQPVGTGYSTGTPTATTQVAVAKQFMGFLKNFLNLFDMKGAELYLVGESYGGKYVPYFADQMLKADDQDYYNITGTMYIDALIDSHVVQADMTIVPFVDNWQNLLQLNDSYVELIHYAQDACGFTDYIDEHLVYPGNPDANLTLPTVDTYTYNGYTGGCTDLQGDIIAALTVINPCFSNIQITAFCPVVFSSIGWPTFIIPTKKRDDTYIDITTPYPALPAVKVALHAPQQDWVECNQFGVSPIGYFAGAAPITKVMPAVLEAVPRNIIMQGAWDMLLTPQGTLMAIQEMTWNGSTGYQEEPSGVFYLPTFSDPSTGATGPAGYAGTTHTEKGLTWVEVARAGHEVPEIAPTAMYRAVEWMLGRVTDLTATDIPYTTDPIQ